MDIQVSVLCTVYNHEKYIRQALQSIVDQKTNFPFEVLVHDDASTDGSASIIREFEEKYPDIIKPIYQKVNQYSQGKHGSMYMFPKVRGKYIAICEGDDYWIDNNKLQMQYDFLENHPDYVLVAHRGDVVNERGDYMYPFSKSTKTDYEKGEVILDTNAFPTASMFYRFDAKNKNNEFLKSGIIFDYMMKSLMSTEGKIYVIPQTMSAYRKGSNGSWTVRVSRDKDKYIKHIRESIDFLEKLNVYRNGEFHNFISQQIRQREFSILMMQRSKENIKKVMREYNDIYKEMPLKSRIRCRILAITGK